MNRWAIWVICASSVVVRADDVEWKPAVPLRPDGTKPAPIVEAAWTSGHPAARIGKPQPVAKPKELPGLVPDGPMVPPLDDQAKPTTIIAPGLPAPRVVGPNLLIPPPATPIFKSKSTPLLPGPEFVRPPSPYHQVPRAFIPEAAPKR